MKHERVIYSFGNLLIKKNPDEHLISYQMVAKP